MKIKMLTVLLGCFLLFFGASQNSFACWPSPKVLTLSQEKGNNNEVAALTITGEKFSKAVSVKLTKTGEADIIADNVTVVSKKQITCTVDLKGKAVGSWDVTIINKNKFLFFKIDKPTKLANGFTIEYSGPTVASVEPSKAGNEGTIAITSLKGAGFRPGASVTLTNQQINIGATKVKVDSDSMIECEFDLTGTTPGAYDVNVTNDDGKSGILPGGFQIVDTKTILSISSVTPISGFNNGSLLINIKGTDFAPDITVNLTGPATIPGTKVSVQSSTVINCFVDLANKPVGDYNVVVTNPDGTTAVLSNGFIIESFSPTKNPNQQLKSIFFDYDKYEIRADQILALDHDLEILNANPNLYILLGGHADERGNREYNLQLSAKRAEAIKDYLVERGVNEKQITVYAYGKDYPAKEGYGESIWSYNRRVDIMIWEQPPTREQGIENLEMHVEDITE